MDDAVARSDGMTSYPSLRFGPDPLALDDDTVDRLLDGLGAADAPPPYGSVAGVLAALRTPEVAPDDELPAALAVFRSARAAGTVAAVPPRRHRARGIAARRAGVAAGVIAGLSLVTATSAAAMTGALPGPAQRAAHDVMSVVGVHVPAPPPTRPLPPAVAVVPHPVPAPPTSAAPHGSQPGPVTGVPSGPVVHASGRGAGTSGATVHRHGPDVTAPLSSAGGPGPAVTTATTPPDGRGHGRDGDTGPRGGDAGSSSPHGDHDHGGSHGPH